MARVTPAPGSMGRGGIPEGESGSNGPPNSFSKNQEVTERKRILPPLTQGLLSSFENDVRKEKAELKWNTEESQIHA